MKITLTFNTRANPVVFIKRDDQSYLRYQRSVFYKTLGPNFNLTDILGKEQWIYKSNGQLIKKPPISSADILYDLEREILLM